MTAEGMRLHDAAGRGTYLIAAERDAFLMVADDTDRRVRTLCMVLA